jgi:hypothetical protein
VERIGYPSTLVVDSVVGLFTLLLLPLMRPSSRPRVASTPALA